LDIREELHKFKNVATTFGQSHRTDEQDRALYLHELDIDSERAYDKICRLLDGAGKDYFFIDKMCKITFVVKTKKPYGFRIQWLSHKQHRPIRTTDCKAGYEFIDARIR
jgi:hypothetical protein